MWSQADINKLPKHIQNQIREQMPQEEKKSKYGNKITIYDGKTFQSKHEAERYAELKVLERAEEITALSLQVPFLIEKANTKNKASYYKADFVYLETKTREWIVEDAKGFETAEYKLKKKAMYNRYGIDIQEV